MPNPEGSFLHERNPKFHASDAVARTVRFLNDAPSEGGERKAIPNQPADKITSYIDFLADPDYANDGILTGDRASIERQVDQAIIVDPAEIPEGYFDLQRRIARNEGRGDIDITDELRQEAARVISGDQRHSLRVWAEYLADNTDYPNWFKHYAFESVTKLGKFDRSKGEFQKRSSGTTVPFPELSRGALSQLHTWVKEAKIDGEAVVGLHGDPTTENFDPEQEATFQKALKLGRFDKLYAALRAEYPGFSRG